MVDASGLFVKHLARATCERYGSLEGYAKIEVLPALERRGLYERREKRLLWFIPVTRWELTRTGEASRAQLRQNRSVGEDQFGEWIRRNPERAYQFLGLAVSSLLLMEALHPELEDLEDGHEVVYPRSPRTRASNFLTSWAPCPPRARGRTATVVAAATPAAAGSTAVAAEDGLTTAAGAASKPTRAPLNRRVPRRTPSVTPVSKPPPG